MMVMPRTQSCALLLSLTAILGVFTLTAANAQPDSGYITAYADESGASCILHDDSPGTFNVYVLHEDFIGANSWQFMVVNSNGFTASYIGETVTPPLLSFGNTQTGIAIAYPGCLSQDQLLVTITYQGLGTSGQCSYIEVVAHPGYAGILTQGCAFEILPTPTRGPLLVNPDASCTPWCIVPTRQTTWGSLKAMYRD